MREYNQDPLALVANHRLTPSHFNTYQSSYNNHQFQQQFLPSQSPQYGSIHPIQHYSTTYPSTPLVINYLSTPYPNAYLSTIHQDAYPQPQSILQIEYTVSIVNQQTYLDEFPQIDSGLAGRQSSFTAGTSRTRFNISGTRGNNSSQQSVMKCFNSQGEGHMARQCLNPKRKRDATLFRCHTPPRLKCEAQRERESS
ncbi:integrase, catalytic region, zinc finger, CCHC-type containing protein [Tanacetum coccineum]